jgi:hypothetical protein
LANLLIGERRSFHRTSGKRGHSSGIHRLPRYTNFTKFA